MQRTKRFDRRVSRGGQRQFALWLSMVVLSACGPDKLTSPLDDLSPDAMAARAVAPLTLTLIVESQTRVDLYWNDRETHEAGWQVFESTDGANGTFANVAELPANSTATALTGKTPGTQYCYKVRAFTNKGKTRTYSAFSNVACGTTPTIPLPAAPTAFDARIPDESCCRTIDFSWTDNSTDDNGFLLEQAGAAEGPWSPLTSLPPSNPNWTLYNAPEEQQLCYRVLARKDTLRSLPSNVDCTAYPRAPSGLTGTGVAGAGIDLAWADNSAVEHGYVIERATVEPWQPYAVIATLAQNAVTYRDATAAANTPYQYRVRVLREGARAASSNEVTAVMATTPPPAPSYLDAIPWRSTEVSVNATSSYTNESGWRLERSADGVTGWTTIATHTSPGIMDFGLQPEQRVCYRMFAFNSQGESPPSPVDCTTPPAAPSDLAVVPLGDGTSRITWRDNSNVEDGYALEVIRLNCDWGECFEEIVLVTVAANVTEYISSEPLVSILAMKDGGYSDYVPFVAPAPAAAAASLQAKVTAEARMLGTKAAMRRPPR